MIKGKKVETYNCEGNLAETPGDAVFIHIDDFSELMTYFLQSESDLRKTQAKVIALYERLEEES